jgi:hypothetical protein
VNLSGSRECSVQPFVRTLEYFTILPSPGSQDGEPFGEEPSGVWWSLDGHSPWETVLREPSRPVQTGSRLTSHRGGRRAVFRATGPRYQSVSRLLYGRRGMAMRSPSHPAGRGSDGLPSGPNSLFERGVTTEADGGRSSYAELSVILRCCSGNHLREPPCTLSQAPQDTSSNGIRRSSG